MLTIAATSLITVAFLILLGAPIGTFIVQGVYSKEQRKPSLLIAFAVLSGFFVSTLAAGWSYGFIGVDKYFVVLLLISLSTWIFLVAKKSHRILFEVLKNGNKSELFLFLVPVLALFLTRPQFQNSINPLLRAGDGPDTMQNIMAAQSMGNLGNTWFEQASKIVNFFGNSNLRETVYNLYQYPSFRDQAGFDYLVYGTRWGLTVPYSQFMKIIGNHTALWETGVVLCISLIGIGIIAFAIAELMNASYIMRFAVTVFAMCNAPFLYQVFNGGLSQAWATPAIMGMSLFIFSVVLMDQSKIPVKYWIIFQTIILSILIGTYIDAAIILGLLLLIIALLIWTTDSAKAKFLIKNSIYSALLSLMISPVLTIATAITFDLRLKAAQSTGIASAIWPFPSEIMGLVNVLSPNQLKRSPEVLLIAILATAYIIYSISKLYLRREKLDRLIALVGFSALIVMLIGFILSYTGKLRTDYIYMKVSVYVSYIVFITFAYSLFPSKIKSIKASTRSVGITLTVFAMGVFATSASATSELSKTGTIIPYEFKPLFQNEKIQNELEKFNYLTTYIPGANFLGVFGNVHWISKAPNDQILGDRMNAELRLICFSADTNCKPATSRISSPELEKYGLIVFESPITTREFIALDVRQRYNTNFTVFGIEPQIIPERFIGGNPYYNEGK